MKILNYFRRFLLKKVKPTDNRDVIRICRINNSPALHDAMGISNERMEQLQGGMLNACYKKSHNNWENFVEFINENCVHVNEVAYCAFIAGYELGSIDSNPMNIMRKMMGGKQ